MEKKMKSRFNWSAPTILLGLVLIFIVGALAGPLVSRSLFRPVQAATAVYDPETIADITEAAAPAVVGVTGHLPPSQKPGASQDEEFFRRFFGMAPPEDAAPKAQRSYGTGFIFRPDGYILTNAHVIEGAAKVEVTLMNERTPVAAKIVGKSSLLDLAVLKIEKGKDLPVLAFGDSDKLRPGEWAIAIGNPLGYDHTVTTGVISATGRRVQAGGARGEQPRLYEDLLQTDAAINPGNSGGPLLDLNGRVIGINAVVSAVGQGIGFAIPINTAREALDQLIENGRYARSWLGVSIVDLTSLDAATASKYQVPAADGVFVVDVTDGSPADQAGLVAGDAIFAIDGRPVKVTDDLIAVTRGHKIGDRVRLTVIHRGKRLEFEVILGEQPDR